MAIHQYRVIIKAKLWVDTPVEGVETEEGTISHLRIRDGIEVFPYLMFEKRDTPDSDYVEISYADLETLGITVIEYDRLLFIDEGEIHEE